MSDAVETTQPYEKIEKFLHLICHKFSEKLGLDFGLEYDLLLSQANLSYMKALEKFDPSRGIKFITFLGKVVWNGLLDERNKTRKFYSIHYLSSDLSKTPDNERSFFLSELLLDLSEEDKQNVFTLIGAKQIKPARQILKRAGVEPKKINPSLSRIKQLIPSS